ncbi:MAG: hypothetical protein K2Q06_15115, partial [Parvularculaceae bacterium]|nr:hypothetical protein [Parvularculaceae bacterium]
VEENDDRVEAFLATAPAFTRTDPMASVERSALLTEAGAAAVAAQRTKAGALQLTPLRTRTDAFFIATLKRA